MARWTQRTIPAVLSAAVLFAACSGESVDTAGYDYLFGAPGAATGLTEDVCRPMLVGGAVAFEPAAVDEALLSGLRAGRLIDPPRLLTGDPYEDSSLVPAAAGGVCGVLGRPAEGYTLLTYPDRAAAEAAGAVVTHSGACGACSPLQDLAVYLAMPDLGGPVRECALIDLGQNRQATQDCILALGFTPPCAQIWVYNSMHTRDACLVECLDALDDPSHLPDGSLNACLACDEAESGPVFKAVAGRTRRNSGIPSAICRPGDSITPVDHGSYP